MNRLVGQLKDGEIVHQYGIGNLAGRGDFVFYKELTIDNSKYTKISRRDFAAAVDSDGIRHILKSNEGTVYRNIVWLSERDDNRAKELLLSQIERKIDIAKHEIELMESRRILINNFFE